MTQLLIACIAFVGTHFLLSHPLRDAITGRIGEAPFLGFYSLIAAATLGWMGYAYYIAPKGQPLWNGFGDGPWAIASMVMLLASILFAGSHSKNPAMPDPRGAHDLDRPASGVFAITRHPMMWAFALWGLAHILVMPTPENMLLSGSVILLALGGSWGQDRKKERLLGEAWSLWEARTSFLPFARQMAGAAPWRASVPARRVILIGIVLWLIATLAHRGLGAGPWRWLL